MAIAADLLTPYQLNRMLSGQTHGLVLGNYRVLERIGGGTVGVVFLGEHMMLRRRVAIKVIPEDESFPLEVLERFHAEMRVLAQLHHPNIVMAYDAGVVIPQDATLPPLHYLVMEHVAGGDLEQYVYARNAPLAVPEACEWIRQAAAGLQEAHDHHLIHRDIKPSNLLLSETSLIKLVDFGLARQFASTLTKPGALLGSLEFMAPEQSLDPTSVSGPADIYGLGATLFWLLTGQTPYPTSTSLVAMMKSLQGGQPRRMREFRPEIPQELDALVDRMLARDPERRPALPMHVMNDLSPYAVSMTRSWESAKIQLDSASEIELPQQCRVVIFDRDARSRLMIHDTLRALGSISKEVTSAEEVFAASTDEETDLIVIEHIPPSMDAIELSQKLRSKASNSATKLVVIINQATSLLVADLLDAGVDEILTRPLDPIQLLARIKQLMRLKESQTRSNQLANHLIHANRQLEDSLVARSSDVRNAQDALLFGLAKMAESKEGETSGHLLRLQRYSLTLAKLLRTLPIWSGIVDKTFQEYLERCVPLHDIGKLGLPDHLLSKVTPLTGAERALVEQHPLLGDAMLEAIGIQFGDSLSFLGMARAIVRHHHERYDGRGYPDHLSGEQIPHMARIVALADVYDAMRRQRAYKPSMSHVDAVKAITMHSPGQFDPQVLQAFASCHDQFEIIYQSIPN